jgi:hypothetical protein
LVNSNRSAPLRSIYTPRTISSSVRRAQSLASRRVRKVLIVVGQPCLRTTAFQVFEGVRVMVANGVFRGTFREHFRSVFRKCTE